MKKNYSKYFKKPSLSSARKRIEKVNKIEFTIAKKYEKIGNGKNFLVKTYGCQGNEADSEKMAGVLTKLGFNNCSAPEEADIILVNTCAVRDNAEVRIFGELGRLSSLKRVNPNLILGICGCMPQEENVVEKILQKCHYVDLVFGTHNIHKLPEYIYAAYLQKERVVEVFSNVGDIVENVPKIRKNLKKAWINIMYGCDEFCTYCIVPYTRGKERSRKSENIILEIEELVKEGYKEVTLLGQNVNAYGNDLDINYKFADLLEELSKTEMKRIRFTTSHPKDLDLRTIEAMARGNNIMEHFHLPVQSGSDDILKKMNRKYTKKEYIHLVKLLKQHMPNISITTDIIVGFPNESREDFEDTLTLYREVEFDSAFTFVYSKREGTPAAKLVDTVSEEEKKNRLHELIEVTKEVSNSKNNQYIGKVVEVLVDSVSKNDEDFLSGYSRENKLVNFKGDVNSIGKIVSVKITGAKTFYLKGEEI